MRDDDRRPPGNGPRPAAGDGRPGEEPTAPTPPSARPGRMRFQDEATTPREPTLAERRARDQAARREAEAARAAGESAAAARKLRKRLLIGGGVTVGVVALIALAYAAGDDDVEARCVDPDGVIVDDSNCVTPVAGSGYYGGGLYPIFIGSGGRQYHYHYGGAGTVGQRVSGGTTTVPDSSTTVRSGTSGRSLGNATSGSSPGGSASGSDSVSRGGLGVSGGGSSSGS